MAVRNHSGQAGEGHDFQPRPASAVMSRARGSAVYPSALNFSRSLVRKMLRQGWRVEKLRTELDDAGRGEAHYRVRAGAHTFDFLAVSNVFPQEQKVDRSFGVNWDVSAAICEGDWSAGREAELRVNIPLQRAGRFDHGVLAFARGNRSERLFDQVVDALARGTQPDAAELASIGYVFRTTGFHSNGAVGMRPYAGIPDDHPLRPSYHAQILLALLMRDFVFDLVDHLAHARGGGAAAALDADLKRYLGIGNSAGLGLIPYLSNHALLIHRWVLTSESARAEALARVPGASEGREFMGILQRAIGYFEEDPRDGNDIFASCALIADGLKTAAPSIRRQLGAGGGPNWAQILPEARDCGHAEVREILESVLLECYPDIVSRHETAFERDESIAVEPGMPLSTLRQRLDASYGWLIDAGRPASVEACYFWYAPQEAPNEPRRGRRGAVPSVELENRMDAPLRALQLAQKLEAEDGSVAVADFLARNPELRSFVGHLQSLGSDGYAVFRDNTLAQDFVPFPSMRFVLAFYGMEKLDPRLPRSVKGAFLQGAPLLADIAQGRDGTWPFAPLPRISAQARAGEARASSVPLRLLETPEAAAASLVRQQDIVRAATLPYLMSSSEIFRTAVKALQTEGLDLGSAEFAAAAVVSAQAAGLDGVGLLVELIEAGRAGAHGALRPSPDAAGYRLEARQDRPLALAPIVLDHAELASSRAADARGWALATGVSGSLLLSSLASHAARRSGAALATWRDGDGNRLATAAWRGGSHAGAVTGTPRGHPRALAGLMGLVLPPAAESDHGLALVCGPGSLPDDGAVDLLAGQFDVVVEAAAPAQAASREERFHRSGASIENALARRFLALGARALVSVETEQRIR